MNDVKRDGGISKEKVCGNCAHGGEWRSRTDRYPINAFCNIECDCDFFQFPMFAIDTCDRWEGEE